MVNDHSLLNSMPVVAAVPERFGVSVGISAFSNRAPRGRKHDFKDAERLVRR